MLGLRGCCDEKLSFIIVQFQHVTCHPYREPLLYSMLRYVIIIVLEGNPKSVPQNTVSQPGLLYFAERNETERNGTERLTIQILHRWGGHHIYSRGLCGQDPQITGLSVTD